MTDRPRHGCWHLWVVLAAVASLLGAGLAAPPAAQAKVVGVGASLGKGTVNAYAKSSRDKKSKGSGKSKSKSGSGKRATAPAVRLQYVLVPDCDQNSPAQTTTGCATQSAGCSAGALRFRVFEAPLGTATGSAAGWTQTAARCLDPTLAHAGQVVIPALGAAELRRLPLPPGTSVVEPPGGLAVINMPVNVYANSAEPTTLRTTVLGLELLIEVEPVAYTWDFGDGTSVGPTEDPGGPYPDLTNTHTYVRPGTYDITMTTTYEARYAVNGGAYQPITGQTAVASAPAPVKVLAGGANLTSEID